MTIAHPPAKLTELEAAKLMALRNAIYHSMRRSHYEKSESLLNFLVLALGTAAVANAAELVGIARGETIFGALTATVGAIQLVWAPSGKARSHAEFQTASYALVAKANAAFGDDKSIANQIKTELDALYGKETTTTMHAVNALAYNAAQNANGRPPEARLPVKWWQRQMANVIAFSPDKFRPVGRV